MDMGQVKQSKNDLLLFEVIWRINISLSGRSDILHVRLYFEYSYKFRSENLLLENLAFKKFMNVTLEKRPRASLWFSSRRLEENVGQIRRRENTQSVLRSGGSQREKEHIKILYWEQLPAQAIELRV